MRLPAVVIGLALAAGCARREDPPDEGGVPGWERRHVSECGFDVELPAPIERVKLNIPEEVYVYAGPKGRGVFAECSRFGTLELPQPEETLRMTAAAHAVMLRGFGFESAPDDLTVEFLAGTPVPTSDYRLRVTTSASTKRREVRGRIFLVGQATHHLYAIGARGETWADYDRVLASYKRR